MATMHKYRKTPAVNKAGPQYVFFLVAGGGIVTSSLVLLDFLHSERLMPMISQEKPSNAPARTSLR